MGGCIKESTVCEIFLNGVTIQLTLIGFPKCQLESKLADCQSYQLIIMTILMSPDRITCNFTFKPTGLLSIISLVQISTLYSLPARSRLGVVLIIKGSQLWAMIGGEGSVVEYST